MWAVFWRIIKDRKIILLVYCLANIGLIWLYIGLFPSIKEQSVNLEQLVKSYPETLLKAFNFDINSFTTIEGFLAGEQFSFVWPIMLIFMLVGFSGSAIAGEIEKGTVEVLLSQPISRVKLFFGRYFAGLMMLALFVILSIFPALPIISAYDISYKLDHFLTLAILCFLFGWAILSIGMMFSSIFSDKGKVFFMTGGLLVVMYVLNIVAVLKDNLANLKYLSFFYYFNHSAALIYDKIDNLAYWVFLGTALVCTLIGAIWFSKRDIAT